MIGSRVLIVDDSAAFRKLLGVTLAPHCSEVLTAASVAEGREKLEEHRDVDLLLSDVRLSDSDAFDLLDYIRELPPPKPRVILMTSSPRDEDQQRALDLGALGVLTKPISVRTITTLLRKDQNEAGERSRKIRRRSVGRAIVRGAQSDDPALLSWEIRDVSASGAFLETWGPVAVGTDLSLTLELGSVTLDVAAVVVRLQEPSWRAPGGVGVYFPDLDEEARRVLRHYAPVGRDEHADRDSEREP